MSEFKVGDRVRLICCRRYGNIVKEKEMFGTRPHYTVLFDHDETDCLVPEEDLEIVDENGKTLLEQRIEKLEEILGNVAEMPKPSDLFVATKSVWNERDLKEEEAVMEGLPIQKSLLTEDERVILRNLDKEWKWIARDEDNELYIFETKPCKESYFWSSEDGNWQINCYFTNLFQFIKWTDKEPYNIEELLKGECGNE